MNTKKIIYAVHCRVKGGGALNVLEAFIIKKVNTGHTIKGIYTLYSDRRELTIDQSKFDTNTQVGDLVIPIITSLPQWINNFFARVDHKKPRGLVYFFDYRNLMVVFPSLMKRLSTKLRKAMKKQSGDVLISSYAVAKNIIVPDGVYKEIYFHQPMHYIWPLYDEYVNHMSGWKRMLYKKITPKLRRRDTQTRYYDKIYANSKSTKQQIKELYFAHQDVVIEIVHPPIEQQFFSEHIAEIPDNYFFYINRLTKMFKHLDVIIKLCNEHKIPLIIAGSGPDEKELKELAGETVTFVGWVSDLDTKITLLKKSRGVFNVAHESFGIVTAEALLLGVPVFGYNGGATPELVDTTSAVLTDSIEDYDSLSQAFVSFIQQNFDRQAIQTRARDFFGQKQKFWQ